MSAAVAGYIKGHESLPAYDQQFFKDILQEWLNISQLQNQWLVGSEGSNSWNTNDGRTAERLIKPLGTCLTNIWLPDDSASSHGEKNVFDK